MNRDTLRLGILILICVIIVSFPIYTGRIFAGEDILFQLNRIEGIKEGLLAGQFPVRIHAYQVNGYGIPLGIFYPDLFLYLPAMLRLLDIPIDLSFQSFCFMVILSMAYVSWYSFSILAKLAQYKNYIHIGAMTAILYISYWYVFLDLYKRTDIGETLALVFFPLVLATVLSVLFGDVRKWPMAVIGIAGIGYSHIISSLFLTGFLLVIFTLNWKCLLQKQRFQAFIKVIIFGLLVNMAILIPFLYFYFNMDFRMPLLYDSNLVQQISGNSWDRWSVEFFLGLQLLWGVPVLVILFLFLVYWYKNKTKVPKLVKMAFFFSMLFMFISTNAFPWDSFCSLPGMGWLNKIQFPWRFMELATPCITFCAAVGLIKFIELKKYYLVFLVLLSLSICILNISIFSNYMDYQQNTQNSKEQYRGDGLPTYSFDGSNDYLYDGISFEKLKNPDGDILLPTDIYSDVDLISFNKQGSSIKFSYRSEQVGFIQVPLFYYEGYKAENENRELLPISHNQDHVMTLVLPKGNHEINVWYAGLPIFKIGDSISLLSIILFLYSVYIENRRRFRRIRNMEKFILHQN